MILAENKTYENISGMVRDRAISSEFLTRKVVQEYHVPRGKFQISPLLVAILDFSRKRKIVNISETVFLPLQYTVGDTHRGSGLVKYNFITIRPSILAEMENVIYLQNCKR